MIFVFLVLVLAGACQIGTTYDAGGFVTESMHSFVQLLLLLQGNGAGGAGPDSLPDHPKKGMLDGNEGNPEEASEERAGLRSRRRTPD